MDNEKTEKKEYEEPTVVKVEFDFNEVIAASGCDSCSESSTNYYYQQNLW